MDIVRDHLERNRSALGLAAEDIDEIVVRDRYRTEKSGLTHLYLRQQIDGIDVEGADMVAAVDREGRLLSKARQRRASID